MSRGILIVVAHLCLSGCNYRYEKFKTSDERLQGEKWYAWVDRTIFQPRCVRCHSGELSSGKVDLSCFSALCASAVVVAKDPEKSALYQSVAQGRMPTDGPLSAAQLDRLRQWILAGAPGDTEVPVDPPPPKPEPKYSWLSKNFFEPQCMKCHSGATVKGDVDMSSYGALMASEGLTMKPVEPGDPNGSGICEQVDTEKMPPGPKKVSEDIRGVLAEWIRKGAPED